MKILIITLKYIYISSRKSTKGIGKLNLSPLSSGERVSQNFNTISVSSPQAKSERKDILLQQKNLMKVARKCRSALARYKYILYYIILYFLLYFLL